MSVVHSLAPGAPGGSKAHKETPGQSTTGLLSAGAMLLEGTEALTDVLATGGLKLVEVYSESWGPCGSVAGVLKKFVLDVTPDQPGQLQVVVVKSEGNKLLEQFRNTSVPHFLFFRNGTRLEVVVGPNAPALDRGLRQYIPKAGEEPDDPMRNRFRPSTAHSTKPPTPAAGVPGPSRPRTADMLALNKLLGGVGGASMHRAGSVSRGRDHFPDGPSLDE